jgi:hypothetical protein
MRFKKIIKMFEDGNVCVTGLRGRGKDMLMSNVVVRRKKPYVSNVDYKAKNKKTRFKPFRPLDYDTKNTHKDFIDGTLKAYEFPHEDGTDIYISDAGVYFPSQYCSELNKQYGGLVNFMALSRHLGLCNVHFNVQNLNRCWDKIREQSDMYISCNKCIVFWGFVLQLVTIYENYDSCVARVPPFNMKKPFMNKDRIQQWEMAYQKYQCSYGNVQRRILFYRNKSKYDTRIFKSMLSGAEIDRNALKEMLKLEILNELEVQGVIREAEVKLNEKTSEEA